MMKAHVDYAVNEQSCFTRLLFRQFRSQQLYFFCRENETYLFRS